MVKGISRQVIVVRQPDRRLFEQAIFIVKEEALSQTGVSAQQVLDEATRVARGYVRSTRSHPKSAWLWGLWGALGGGALASALWAAALLL